MNILADKHNGNKQPYKFIGKILWKNFQHLTFFLLFYEKKKAWMVFIIKQTPNKTQSVYSCNLFCSLFPHIKEKKGPFDYKCNAQSCNKLRYFLFFYNNPSKDLGLFLKLR